MPASNAAATGQRPLDVALVNNMPDAAFVDTEEQFRGLVHGALGEIDLRLYTIEDFPRSEETRALIDERYGEMEELWARPPDALIITGTEPVQAKLHYEPYWPVLARLLEWSASAGQYGS